MEKGKIGFCRAVFRGQVQGVGFRYTASRAARALLLRGFVKNHSDGSVEVQLEGEAEAMEKFLEEVTERMKGYISGTEVEWGEGQERFGDFQVRF